MKLFKKLICFVIILSLVLCVPIIPANAAPTKPTLKDDPMHGQILPFYEVWLRWYDVPDEAHYTMTIRDLGYEGREGDDGSLIYNRQYVAQNSTYFVVPTSKLIRGHHYRWCLNSVDANGNRTIADAVVFAIEEYDPDRHFIENSTGVQIIPKTHTMEYFVYAESEGYDPILNQAAQNWNGHANVTLVRTATPTDGEYEIGIFESPSPPDVTINGQIVTKFGLTVTDIDDLTYQVEYSEVRTFKDNIDRKYNSDDFYVKTKEGYYLSNAMHEIGHALLLFHTWGDNEDRVTPGYDISKTLTLYGNRDVPLIMNSGARVASELNVVDRDHLRMKWGS